ncbi:6-phosphogluconolactonase [Rhizoclosmatium globosum]|uniref:6-phosphogluconolactonase n=1 Tax=Rhizoclosmatium globosum TaxID=329046 RepID=A0A1Y2B4I4_9FUNG|nr:6-phosphogluconolactonase [Rhizoclosmatium globosum]|eukprot:ORY29460.1 6-phosphogluconolactonase [Rhizoclosmatium globosum]
MGVKAFATSAAISTAIAADITTLSSSVIAATGRFVVAFSGGSLPSIVAKDLAKSGAVDWTKWHVFLADERCVPNTHKESNYALIKQELLSKVPIPASQIHPINDALLVSQDGACSDQETAAIADDYKNQLVSLFGSEDKIVFDLVLLGMGPDGHTCSLFPKHHLLRVTSTPIAYLTDSPKPPPARITLTYPVLNASQHVWFVSTGEGKAQVLKEILVDGVEYPSGLGIRSIPTSLSQEADTNDYDLLNFLLDQPPVPQPLPTSFIDEQLDSLFTSSLIQAVAPIDASILGPGSPYLHSPPRLPHYLLPLLP